MVDSKEINVAGMPVMGGGKGMGDDGKEFIGGEMEVMMREK